MADFTPHAQTFKPSFSFPDFMDPTNLELIPHYSASTSTNPPLNFTNFLPFSNDMFFPHQSPSEFPQNLEHSNFSPILSSQIDFPTSAAATEIEFYDMKKRKPMDVHVSESTSGISTPQVSETGYKTKNVYNNFNPINKFCFCFVFFVHFSLLRFALF